MQRLNIYLKFSNTLLCVGGLSLIISDQEDERIWKILAMQN